MSRESITGLGRSRLALTKPRFFIVREYITECNKCTVNGLSRCNGGAMT